MTIWLKMSIRPIELYACNNARNGRKGSSLKTVKNLIKEYLGDILDENFIKPMAQVIK